VDGRGTVHAADPVRALIWHGAHTEPEGR